MDNLQVIITLYARLGDVFTTLIGMRLFNITEKNPVAFTFMSNFIYFPALVFLIYFCSKAKDSKFRDISDFFVILYFLVPIFNVGEIIRVGFLGGQP
jgi:hypothetical protein